MKIFLCNPKKPYYRKEFTSVLNQYLEMGIYKYALYTDAIYKAIFKENASNYKQILQLEEKENPRDIMYAEVLKLIASFESGISYEMKKNKKREEESCSRRNWIFLLKIFLNIPYTFL
jgi:hypothetical protein